MAVYVERNMDLFVLRKETAEYILQCAGENGRSEAVSYTHLDVYKRQLQMFSALKYFGVETRMCLFHGENHELSRSGKPSHRLRRLSEMMEWFEKYLKQEKYIL